MTIKDNKTLATIQKEFKDTFPYLKIEFYQGHHEAGEGSPGGTRLDPEQTIGAVRTVKQPGELAVTDDMTVKAFEQEVYRRFGLNVQVFRKSGNLWMQTTSTDDWTLQEQNRKGGSSEAAYREKYEQE